MIRDTTSLRSHLAISAMAYRAALGVLERHSESTIIIAKIETFPLRIPFKPDTHAAASAWGNKGRPVADSLLVKVTTDRGLEGWGEAFGFRAVRSAKLAVDELIAPLCVGKDAAQIGPLMFEVQVRVSVREARCGR